jgi:hypothetical protein
MRPVSTARNVSRRQQQRGGLSAAFNWTRDATEG